MGPNNLFALDSDRWSRAHDLYWGFLYPEQAKLSLRSRATIQDSFSYGETRSLRKFVYSIFLTTFWLRAWELFCLVFALFLNLAGDVVF